jgi:hypothetical protein
MKNPPATTPPLYAQDGNGYDAIVYAHYFLGGSDWLITEYDPNEDIAFGWVCLNRDRDNAELGYVYVAELRQFRAPIRLTARRVVNVPVELDENWTPCTLNEGIAQLDAQRPAGLISRRTRTGADIGSASHETTRLAGN